MRTHTHRCTVHEADLAMEIINAPEAFYREREYNCLITRVCGIVWAFYQSHAEGGGGEGEEKTTEL